MKKNALLSANILLVVLSLGVLLYSLPYFVNLLPNWLDTWKVCFEILFLLVDIPLGIVSVIRVSRGKAEKKTALTVCAVWNILFGAVLWLLFLVVLFPLRF